MQKSSHYKQETQRKSLAYKPAKLLVVLAWLLVIAMVNCDSDLIIVRCFDSFWASRPPGLGPVGSENFLKAKNAKKNSLKNKDSNHHHDHNCHYSHHYNHHYPSNQDQPSFDPRQCAQV